MLRQGSIKEVTVARTAKRDAAATDAPKGSTASAGPRPTGTPTGTARTAPAGRPQRRGPAAGIGSPIYDELVSELGDPAA